MENKGRFRTRAKDIQKCAEHVIVFLGVWKSTASQAIKLVRLISHATSSR